MSMPAKFLCPLCPKETKTSITKTSPQRDGTMLRTRSCWRGHSFKTIEAVVPGSAARESNPEPEAPTPTLGVITSEWRTPDGRYPG